MSQEIKLNYNDRFKCIAGECSLTCCQEWRITVDEVTEKKWQGKFISGREEQGQKLELCQCLKEEALGKIIKLNDEKKCPFLNQDKLCKLVIELGEDYLSHTCMTFPRQNREFTNRTEHTLAACCPAVVDLMRQQAPEFIGHTLEPINEKTEELLYHIREMMVETMKADQYTLPQRMMMIFFNLLEALEDQHLSLEKIKAKGQQLTPLIKAISKMSFSEIDALLESNELFLDVVENYRKQGLYVSYLEKIAQLAETLETDYEEENLLVKRKAFEKDFCAYKELLERYLIAELLGNTLLIDSQLKDVVIAFEWITLEYAVLRQALFLKWLEQGEKPLPYEIVRDYISVVARVTGYDAEDIEEYLENSFEEVIWDWGYLAMVLGNGLI